MFKKINVLCLDRVIICMILCSILSALTIGYIFYNSSQNSKTSNEKSSVVAEKVQPIVDPEKKIDEKEFHKAVRETAHFIEFSILGLCFGGLFMSIYCKYKKKYISLPLLLSLSVAVMDEFIQKFTERTSNVKDILVDFGGASTGLLLVACLMFFMGLRRRKKTAC